MSARRRPVGRLGPTRRSHHLRRGVAVTVAAAVVVALAVGLAGQVDRQSLPYRRSVDRSFASLLGPLGAQSVVTAEQVAATLDGVASTTRTALLTALAVEARTAAQTATTAQADVPPFPSAPAAGDCLQALTERATAVADARQAVSDALGGPTGTSTGGPGAATTLMASAAAAAQAGDADWAACRASLRRSAGAARLRSSSWETGGTWQEPALDADLAAVGAAPRLAAAPGLNIDAVTTVPAALAASGSPPTYLIPATASARVLVVLTNTGNVTLPAVDVQVTAQGPVPDVRGAAAARRGTGRTATLAAGASASLTVGGLAVEPGATTVLTASAMTVGGATVAPPVSVTVSVAQAVSTAAVTAAPQTVRPGRPVTYTATITGSLAATGVPTGTVAFEDAEVPVPGCTAQPLRHGTATCTVTYPAAGFHSITVTYGGTAAIAGTTSPAITETVASGSGAAPSSSGSASPSRSGSASPSGSGSAHSATSGSAH